MNIILSIAILLTEINEKFIKLDTYMQFSNYKLYLDNISRW